MSRGYGKYRRGGSHSSFHFDNLFKENANKPSAARSAATVGKWGITSFTSIRTVNGRPEPPAAAALPKPKKFFKSRNNSDAKSSPTYNPEVFNESTTTTTTSKRNKYGNGAASEKPAKRKFFAAKAEVKSEEEEEEEDEDKTVLCSNANKPPIVLRICRGKSQLVNDSDESESTPTPSSTPSTSTTTSPRTLRSPNCRITRSARRSMQQDNPNSSPQTADTPGEFSLFTSPKPDLSPQYIPAERYELERKAMYDNLLNSNANNDTEPEPPKYEEEPMAVAPASPAPSSPPQMDEPVPPEEPQQQQSLVQERVKPPVDDWDSEENEDEDENVEKTAELATQEPILEKQTTDEHPMDDKDEKYDAERHEDEEEPPVKLVISKKKGSIFKSRALITDGVKTRRAMYKHKWSGDDKEGAGGSGGGGGSGAGKSGDSAAANQAPSSVYDDDFGFNDDPLTKVSSSSGKVSADQGETVTSIKCTKKDKLFYTVVRNVKKAHQIQEIGEFQEFNDDVEYILDALQDNNPISTRCLSAITLASKCMVPAFRMHVRAHGTVAKFFKALHDATKDQSLGLCTATVMFVLSQDRLNMDLDRDCLELMLNLLESDVSYQQALDECGLSSAQLEKNKQKVRELCAEIQSQGHAMHLNLDNITVGQLAMETLLSLTSKRAGEWFKEELRELGGLEHIMKTICECCRQVSDYVVTWTDVLLHKLKKVDRCLRVLENVTHNNEENQTYLLKYSDGMILDTLVNLYKLCDREIPLYPVTDISDKESTGTIIREALLVTLKVLINLTHHFSKQSLGSSLIGSRPGIIEISLHLLLQVPHYIPEQKKFELGVLVLMLLINLIQDNESNKKLLMEAKAPSKLESIYSREESAVEALIAQFYHWEGCAKIAEKRTNAILDGEKDTETPSVPKSNEEFIEETVAKLLQKAGTHMEYTFLASYIVMLIGFLIMETEEYRQSVRQYLKGNNFVDMVELLKKFFNFMNLTASTEASSVCAVKATEKVIKFLEECDKPVQNTECMDLSTMAH